MDNEEYDDDDDMSTYKNDVVSQTVTLNYFVMQKANSLKWGVVNGALFMVFMYDICCKCSDYTSLLHYVEYILAAVSGANLLHYSVQLMKKKDVLWITPDQHKLLGLSTTELDTTFQVYDDYEDNEDSEDYADCTEASYADSDDSEESESLSISLSPLSSCNDAPLLYRFINSFKAKRRAVALHRRRSRRRSASGHRDTTDNQKQNRQRTWVRNWLTRNVTAFPKLLTPFYQLASADTEKNGKLDENSPQKSQHKWWKLHLDPQRLTVFNLNLRLWLTMTILERLVGEVDALNASFEKHGLSDVRIGEVSVERLRKTAVSPYGGSLSTLLPFLDAFPDQRYVVQRIRDLASGGSLSNYKWNGGGSDWDASKPTDAELVLALFAAYLDAQLPASASYVLNVPNTPRPFSSAHVSAAPDRSEHGPNALAIHRVTRCPPHYVLILEEETLEVEPGRNNLLHTMLLFVAAAARLSVASSSIQETHYSPVLHRVHLGPAGLNMLWIIGR